MKRWVILGVLAAVLVVGGAVFGLRRIKHARELSYSRMLDQADFTYEHGDRDRALEQYTQAIKQGPEYGAGYHLRGIAYLDEGEYEQAAEDFTRAVEIYRAQGEGSTHWVDTSRKVFGQESLPYWVSFNRQQKATKQAIADALKFRGLARVGLGDCGEAIQDYEEALRLHPDSGEIDKRAVESLKAGAAVTRRVPFAPLVRPTPPASHTPAQPPAGAARSRSTLPASPRSSGS